MCYCFDGAVDLLEGCVFEGLALDLLGDVGAGLIGHEAVLELDLDGVAGLFVVRVLDYQAVGQALEERVSLDRADVRVTLTHADHHEVLVHPESCGFGELSSAQRLEGH